MKFFDQLSAFYKLYQDGTLDNLLGWVNSAKNKKGKIDTQFDVLEKSLDVAKNRLVTIENATVRKALDLKTDVDFESQHICFETTYRVILAGLTPFLVGPAGSGKSTILAQIADAMNLSFYPIPVNSLTENYNLIGHIDATSNYIPTPLYWAYKDGGVVSLEEIDAGNANVLTLMNTLISQDEFYFPCDTKDNPTKKHPKFILAASGNTYGTGANIKYIGRNPLDAATLDRLTVIRVDYDTEMEDKLCQNKDWLDFVHRVRDNVDKLGMPYVVGTRAVVYGEQLLNTGLSREAVEQMVVFKGMPSTDIDKIRGKIR